MNENPWNDTGTQYAPGCTQDAPKVAPMPDPCLETGSAHVFFQKSNRAQPSPLLNPLEDQKQVRKIINKQKHRGALFLDLTRRRQHPCKIPA